MCQVFHQSGPPIEKTIEWSSPFFEYKAIVGSMAAFEQHAGHGFRKADLMFDPRRMFERTGIARGARPKPASVDDMPAERASRDYIREAVELDRWTLEIARPTAKTVQRNFAISDDFRAALEKNEQALATFERFPETQHEQCIAWTTEAKRETTHAERLATVMGWIAECIPRNGKSMKGRS